MAQSDAFEKYPQHRLEIDEARVALRVTLNGVVLAETRRGLNLLEGDYPAVVYIPREDVAMDRLERSALSTHCPFKGDASYFDWKGESETSPQVAWSYETPFDQMIAIREHLAFYPDRVEIETIGD